MPALLYTVSRAVGLFALLLTVTPGLATRPTVEADAAPSFTLTKLDPFGSGAGNVFPLSVNNSGQITGLVHVSSTVAKGFYFQPAAKGTGGHSYAVPVPKGDSSADFNSLNDAGNAAGYVCLNVSCSQYLPYAGQIGGSKVALTPLKGPRSGGKIKYGSAFQINKSGTITGYVVLKSGQLVGLIWKNSGSSTSPRWTTPVAMIKPASFSSVYGTALDASGDVAGYAVRGNLGIETISGTSGSPAVLPGFQGTKVSGVTQSFAQAVYAKPSTGSGNRSLVVVGSSYESGTGQAEGSNPCLWNVTISGGKVRKVSAPVELGQDYNEPSGGNGVAYGINSHGWVVGDAGLSDQSSPMLWINSGEQPVSSGSSYLLQNTLPFDSPAFALEDACSVNDNGVIVGRGAASGTKLVPGKNLPYAPGTVFPGRFGYGVAGQTSSRARSETPEPLAHNRAATARNSVATGCGSSCDEGYILTPK